jgi:hypothetical protein
LETLESFRSQLYRINDTQFDDIALRLFSFQAANNAVYREYISHLGVGINDVRSVRDIPFLPISFFKQHIVKTGAWQSQGVFESSGTTGSALSAHHIFDLSWYLDHCQQGWERVFGPLTNFHFFALLPSYLERSNSSLVAMMNHFITKSGSSLSGFYLHNEEKLLKDLDGARHGDRRVVVFGVTFALVELAERFQPDLGHCLIFETGGMKGRRREMIREELHGILKRGFNVRNIFSEYGMTELMSQAYSDGESRFLQPPWLKIIGRDLYDPLQKGLQNETVGINVIDLGNYHSAAFIETEDIGRVNGDGSFEISGRMDNSDLRGCNLLVQ